MSITVEDKARLIKEYATKENDTGPPDVQVAILSSRIATLTEDRNYCSMPYSGGEKNSLANSPAPKPVRVW